MKELVVEDWDGNDIEGVGIVTFKIDGIQVRNIDGKYVSKNGNPLYNLPDVISDQGFRFAEAFRVDWNTTWSVVSASKSPRKPLNFQTELFPIDPLDFRLFYTTFGVLHTGGDLVLRQLSTESINRMMDVALGRGHEGLVIQVWKEEGFLEVFKSPTPEMTLEHVTKLIKVKPKNTVDVKILGFVTSTAKSHYGLLKEFVTEKGKVGIGLTREQRKEYLDDKYIGTYIEVETTGYTKAGKFRHARFKRLRPDK